MTIKTENQIYSDIVGFLNTALTQLPLRYEELQGFDFSEWQVLQLKQPVKLTEIKPTLYVTYTNTTPLGWTGRKYLTSVNGFRKQETQKEQLQFQFSALKRRKITDTVNTLNSKDLLKYLRIYMTDIETGLKQLKTLGYSIFRPQEIQCPDFFDDSENFEFMPFFNVTFILDQSLISPQTVIDDYILKVRSV